MSMATHATTTDRAAALWDLWFRDDPADGSRDIEIDFETQMYRNPPCWTISLREGNEDTARWHRFYGHDLDELLTEAQMWCEELLPFGDEAKP